MTTTTATATATTAPGPAPASSASAAFAVVACSHCRKPWAVELRHANATCPSCHTKSSLAGRARLWQGATAADAQAAAATLRAGEPGAAAIRRLAAAQPLPRHDSHVDAAAAQAAGIANKSSRAEMVALWLTRLSGSASHAEFLDALQRAGLDAKRSEAEVVRMLAMDILMEPRAGHYRVVDA